MSVSGILLAVLAPLVQTVAEYERWHLSFDAKVEGAHVIENFPQYEKLFFCGLSGARNYGQPLAGWRVRFTDAAGQEVRQAPNGGAFYTSVFSSKKLRYDDEFTVPPGGVKMTVSFHEPNRGESLVVTDVNLSKVENPPTLNVNPDFASGPRGFAGWSAGYNRRIEPDPDRAGGFRLVIGGNGFSGSARSDWIPVRPGDTVRFAYRMRASVDGRGGRVVVMRYRSTAQRDDCPDGELAKKFYLGSRWTEGQHDFVVPPETAILRLYAENATISYARFTRVAKGE